MEFPDHQGVDAVKIFALTTRREPQSFTLTTLFLLDEIVKVIFQHTTIQYINDQVKQSKLSKS